MDRNENMTAVYEENDYEVVEARKPGNKLAKGALVGAAIAVVGGLAYKFIVKPMRAKKQASQGGVDPQYIDANMDASGVDEQ